MRHVLLALLAPVVAIASIAFCIVGLVIVAVALVYAKLTAYSSSSPGSRSRET